LHEYKRQFLNALCILELYFEIKEGTLRDFTPTTFIFGAKAAPGYFRAKGVIKFINEIAKLIENDSEVNPYIKVVFVSDYNVSYAEKIIAAADVSEQISTAGTEASGTGNMKLMINGAVTLGTLDGANVEIFEQVGKDNIFLFGMNVDEVNALWSRGYNPVDFLNADSELREVIGMLTSGVLGKRFDNIAASLLTNRYGCADQYMTIADFADYARAQREVSNTYLNREKFMQMSLANIAGAGIFSADRAVKEYAEKIWKLK
jgi:starch phosphorylase